MKALPVCLLLAGAISAVAADASAFVITCRRHTAPHTVHRMLPAAPNGSARAAAISTALGEWNRIIPISRWITEGSPDQSGTQDLEAAPSQIGFTSGTLHLGDALGKAFVRVNFGVDVCPITGFDILMTTRMTYVPPGDSLPGGGPDGFDPGWHAVLHEFGHAFGLHHPTTFAVMRASTPAPSFGAFPFFASAAAPAPDDAAAMRALYGKPANSAALNVTSTQTQLKNGTIDRVWTPSLVNGAVSVCRGSSFPIPSHTANTGISTVTINHRIYMQPVLPAGQGNPWHAGDPRNVTIAGHTGSVHGANNTLMINHTARVPCNTPAGTYHVMHYSDSTDSVPNEYNEADNTSQYPVPVVVRDCHSITCLGSP